ncbi:MAG: hypothetical protein WBA57_27565 [Elainellaceae cyanobacterium]
MKINWFEALVVGIVMVVIVLPTLEKTLSRRHLDLNGVVTDFIESTREAVSRPVGTPSPEQ